MHTSLTPTFYGRLSSGAMWFAGSGLAMVFVGLLNITFARVTGRNDRLVWALCHIANLTTLAFGAPIVVVDSEPQVIFGLVLITVMTIPAFLLRK